MYEPLSPIKPCSRRSAIRRFVKPCYIALVLQRWPSALWVNTGAPSPHNSGRSSWNCSRHSWSALILPAIAGYKAGPQGIRYPKEEINGDQAIVHTEITSERDLSTAVNYHLLHKDSDWKVL